MATTAHHLSVFRGVRERCMEESRLAYTLEPKSFQKSLRSNTKHGIHRGRLPYESCQTLNPVVQTALGSKRSW